MTLSLTKLSRLLAKIVGNRRSVRAASAVSACGLATLLASPAHAQLIDGLIYPAQPSVVGSSAVMSDPDTGYEPGERYSMNGQSHSSQSHSIYVGPGGATSPVNVPSAVSEGGAPQAQSWQTEGWPNRNYGSNAQRTRTKLVNQPMAQGPFLQSEPVYSDPGYSIPCPCDAGCDFTYYASAEALYFRRDLDDRFTAVPTSPMNQFDYEWAGRVTVGQVYDCVNGYEGVYSGPFKWTRSGISPGVSQSWQARLNTWELNRRWWAWDTFSLLAGLRYVDYRENYGVQTTNGVQTITLLDRTRNAMIGPQIGGDLMQPFGLRTLFGFKGKAALLANFTRNEIFQSNLPPTVFWNDSDVEVAGMFEAGAYAKYSITPSIRVSAGYELWYLAGVATVPDQIANIGSKVNTDGDALFHGATLGAQILY